MKSTIVEVFDSLLSDIASLTNLREIRGSWWSMHWLLTEAHQLEKYIQSSIENDSDVDFSRFPVPLQRLARLSTVDGLHMRYLRQILLFAYKAEVQHDNQQLKGAFNSYVAVSKAVGEFAQKIEQACPATLDLARRYCQSIVGLLDFTSIRPMHGPGAVTTSKERWQHWYTSINSVYPYGRYFVVPCQPDHEDQLLSCTVKDTIEAKVIAVPKDVRGPRLICVHPAEAVWVQQGVRKVLERGVQIHRFSQNVVSCSGKIRFNDQTVNGRIAMIASRTRKWATLDLKDASDRVGQWLVSHLFGEKYRYLACSRASSLVMPQINATIEATCYAPMGNATVFPVQSIVFWSICCAALQVAGCKNPASCFVFGDDILVPSKYAPSVVKTLESFGLAVNKDKSFWRGPFRESCGVDAFDGINVTPIRWKLPLVINDVSDLQPLSMLAMALRRSGYEEAASACYKHLRRFLRLLNRNLDYTNNPDHGGIAEYTLNPYLVPRAYWHKAYQYWVTRVWRLTEARKVRASDDWNHYLAGLIRIGESDHKESGSHVSRRVRITRGWTRVV